MKATLKAPISERLKLECDDVLSNVAFNFKLRRYSVVVRSNMAYVKRFHPETFDQINANNAMYGMINDFIANSPVNWMFDYYS
jgi:hypothetical protein